MSLKTHVHEFRIPRQGRASILYRHRVKAKHCGTHACATPSTCWCEPEIYERPERSSKTEYVMDVIHQAKSRDEKKRECLHD